MSKIINTDLSVLGSLNLNPQNKQGRVLTIDGINVVGFRTLSELANDIGISAGLSDKYFVYDQALASSQWIINHNLEKRPSVTVVDSANNVVIGEIDYTDQNTLTLNFNSSFTGTAYLN